MGDKSVPATMDDSLPIEDPERKRQWEREHRKQRNARRRALRFAEATAPQNPVPDPTPTHQAMSGWKDILGLAVEVGIIILGALSGGSWFGWPRAFS
jgi:hypothetical protein